MTTLPKIWVVTLYHGAAVLLSIECSNDDTKEEVVAYCRKQIGLGNATSCEAFHAPSGMKLHYGDGKTTYNTRSDPSIGYGRWGR